MALSLHITPCHSMPGGTNCAAKLSTHGKAQVLEPQCPCKPCLSSVAHAKTLRKVFFPFLSVQPLSARNVKSKPPNWKALPCPMASACYCRTIILIVHSGTKHANVRSQLICDKARSVDHHIHDIKEWQHLIQSPPLFNLLSTICCLPAIRCYPVLSFSKILCSHWTVSQRFFMKWYEIEWRDWANCKLVRLVTCFCSFMLGCRLAEKLSTTLLPA